MPHPARLLAVALAALALCAPAFAQRPPLTSEQIEERRRLSELAAADHRRTMDLLGLPQPGPFPAPEEDPTRPPNTTRVVGNPYNWTDGQPGHVIVRSGWGNWSNYDYTKADLGPLPEVLKLQNGDPVRDAHTWWQKRRPEILALFETEIYGRIPADTPAVTWEVTATDDHALGGTAKLQRLLGRIDNSRHPAATPTLDVALYLPPSATKPVPVIVIFGGGFRPGVPPAVSQILAEGWGCAVFNPNALQLDSGGGLAEGIIGLMNRGQPRTDPSDWGSLAAISWGLSRVIDHFETLPAIDARRLGLQGHSRWGKATLVAMAYEPRWAIGFSSCSGTCGAALFRHNIGQNIDNVAGQSEYHWMAPNFLKYAGHWLDIPIDQHQLIALIAPRPVFITGGTEDLWSDPVGEFKACVAQPGLRTPRRERPPHRSNARPRRRACLRRPRLPQPRRRPPRRPRLAHLPGIRPPLPRLKQSPPKSAKGAKTRPPFCALCASLRPFFSVPSVTSCKNQTMPRLLLFLFLLPLSLFAASTSDPKSEITAATQSWADAFNSRQLDRVLAQYAPDAVLWGTRSQIVRDTPELIRDYFSNMPTQPHTRVTLGESRIRLFGAIAINTGTYTFTGRAPDRTPTTSPARFTFVFAQRDNRWLIIEHHSSAVPAAR